MRTREVAGLIAALLLALPLVLLVLSLKAPELWEFGTRNTRLSPVLDLEARMRLDSYQRACRSSSECEAPLGCLEDIRTRTTYCTDSQCTADPECPEGQVCRGVPTRGGGPLVRLCTLVGARQEGQRCWRVPPDTESACGAGLLCGGEGWCARPCQAQDAASCPAGFFCADVAPEPVCLPTCQGRPCPKDQRCVRFKDGVSACARVHGPACQDDASCGECEVAAFPRHAGEVWMQCIQRCGAEGLPSCPGGSACKIGRCSPICDREAPDACPDGFYCAPPWAGQPPVCEPKWKQRG